MPALGQHDIQQAVAVEIADADAGRRFGSVLEQLDALKGSEHWLRMRRRLATQVEQDEKGDYPSCSERRRAKERPHDSKGESVSQVGARGLDLGQILIGVGPGFQEFTVSFDGFVVFALFIP